MQCVLIILNLPQRLLRLSFFQPTPIYGFFSSFLPFLKNLFLLLLLNLFSKKDLFSFYTPNPVPTPFASSAPPTFPHPSPPSPAILSSTLKTYMVEGENLFPVLSFDFHTCHGMTANACAHMHTHIQINKCNNF